MSLMSTSERVVTALSDGGIVTSIRWTGCGVIGTDDCEWLSGSEAFGVFADPSAHVDPKPSIVLNDLEAYEHGDVGWVACRPQLSLPDATVLSLRWTGVFERNRGAWKLRQLHVSTG